MKITGKFTHRGLYTLDQSIGENTLEAFDRACQYGYGIELDVQLSQDNEVVVTHDYDLMRLFEVECKVRSIKADTLMEKYNIPRLEEVLNKVDGQVSIIVELKSMNSDNSILCRKTLELIEKYHGDVCVESFDPRIVLWFKKNAPHIIRGQLIMGMRSYGFLPLGYFIANGWSNKFTSPHFIALRKDVATTPKVKKFYRKQGLPIVGWTLHENDDNWYDAIIFEHYLP